jgi:hypothetical protein
MTPPVKCALTPASPLKERGEKATFSYAAGEEQAVHDGPHQMFLDYNPHIIFNVSKEA